ncbi:MAG: methyltransferase domain-containing protein [Planctomycetota bacterium]
MYLYRIENREQWQALFAGDKFRDRYLLECHLARLLDQRARFTIAGICMACNEAVDFVVDRAQAVQDERGCWQPQWRESQICPGCHLNSRQRAAVGFVSHAVRARPAASVYLMEQLSPVFETLRRMFPSVELTGSEYLGPDVEPGGTRNQIRHENAEQLSFTGQSFDLVVSNDVLEHVSDPRRALREMHRVLRDGGELFLSVPFATDCDANVTRARREHGRLVTELPPVYHGDPLSAQGVLVYTDFGWQLLDLLRSSGFLDVAVVKYWSCLYGHIGIPQLFIHAHKRGA